MFEHNLYLGLVSKTDSVNILKELTIPSLLKLVQFQTMLSPISHESSRASTSSKKHFKVLQSHPILVR